MAIRERTAATGTSPTSTYQVSVTLPASIVSGDLLVAFGGQTTTGGIVEPTGWTAVNEKHHGNGSHQYGMWYKVADGSEASTTVTWSNASSSLTQAWVMHVVPFYDDGGTAWDSPPLDTFDWSEVIDTTALTAPTITTGVNNALLVWGTSIREGVAGSASFTQSGVTELADANSAITGAVMGAIVQATAGATSTISSTASIICTRLGGVLASFRLAASGGATQDIAPTLLTNTQSFFGPTLSAGPVDIAPSLLTNTQSFFAPTITPGAVDVAPALHTNTQTFFAPTVANAAGAQDIAPSLLTNAQTFFAPTLTPGVVTVAPSLLTNTQAFFAPSLTPGAVTLSPSLLTSTQTFYTPVLATGAGVIAPDLLTNTQVFYEPTFTFGGVTITPDLLVNLQTFYVPSVGEPQFAPSFPITGSIPIYAITGSVPAQTITGSVPAYSVTGQSA